jgi:hypothetical protein
MRFLIVFFLLLSCSCSASEPSSEFKSYLAFVQSTDANSSEVFRFLTPHWKSNLSVLNEEQRTVAYEYIYFPRHIKLKRELSSSIESCLIWEAEHLDLLPLIPSGQAIRISISMVKGIDSWQIDTVGFYPYKEDNAICE